MGIEVDVFFEETAHLRNLFGVDMLRQMAQIDPDMFDVVIRVENAPSLADFRFDGPGHQVPGGQLLHLGGIALHEGLQVLVAQDAADGAQRLAGQDAGTDDPGGVKLDRFRVHDRQSGLQHQGQAVAGVLAAVGGHLEHLPAAARGEHRGLGEHPHEFALFLLENDAPDAPPLLEQQFRRRWTGS